MIVSKPRNKFEQSGWDFLTKNNVDFQYEGLKLPYTINATYHPDFILKKSGIILEFKGYLRVEEKRKMKSVKKDHPKLDIRFVFQKEKESEVRWAKKNGFPYAIGQIPKAWLKND